MCVSNMEAAGGSTRLETCSGRLLRPLGQFASAAAAVGTTSSVVPESCRDATLMCSTCMRAAEISVEL